MTALLKHVEPPDTFAWWEQVLAYVVVTLIVVMLVRIVWAVS